MPRIGCPVALSTLALVLMGCAGTHGLAPTGRPLDAAEVHAEKALAGVALSPAYWPSRQWWRALDDPELDALVDEGLRNSPNLAAAEARLRQAQAQAGARDAERKPALSVSAGYTGLQLPASMLGEGIGGHYGGSGQGVLDFSYGFDLWGGKRASWEAAVDRSHAAEVDAQAARLELSAAIVQAYAELDQAWRMRDLADAERTRAQRVLDLTGQRRAAGIDGELQVRQAEARVPAAQQQLDAAQQRIHAARNALAALLGRGPDRGLSIQRPQLTPMGLQLPSVLPAELLGRRPDVVAARWRVEAAGMDIASAKTLFYPSLDLTALGGVVNKDVDQLFKHASVLGLVAPALSLPIFDGGRRRAHLADTDAAYDLAVADYNQKVVGALREVTDQVDAMRALDAQANAQSQALATASAAQTLAEQRYRAGIGSYLEVLSVQEQVLAAQQRMVTLRSQQIEASVNLRRALGGGFVVDPTGLDASASKHF